jgi:hypothetical protein
VSKHESAPLLTIVNLGLSDHTLDGILDIICFSFLNWGWLHEFLTIREISGGKKNLLFVVGHFSDLCLKLDVVNNNPLQLS